LRWKAQPSKLHKRTHFRFPLTTIPAFQWAPTCDPVNELANCKQTELTHRPLAGGIYGWLITRVPLVRFSLFSYDPAISVSPATGLPCHSGDNSIPVELQSLVSLFSKLNVSRRAAVAVNTSFKIGFPWNKHSTVFGFRLTKVQNSLQRNLFAWPRTRNSACSTARSVVGLKCHQVIWPPSRFRGPLPQTPLFKVEFRFVHCPISKRATRLFYAASSCTPYVCFAGFFDLCLITSDVEAFSKICVSHEICQFSGERHLLKDTRVCHCSLASKIV